MKILCAEKTVIFVAVFLSVRWVNQAWTAELTFSIPTLLMRSLPGDAVIYYKARIFSFADMLPLKVSTFYNIKQINNIPSLKISQNITITPIICKTEFVENILLKKYLNLIGSY